MAGLEAEITKLAADRGFETEFSRSYGVLSGVKFERGEQRMAFRWDEWSQPERASEVISLFDEWLNNQEPKDS